VHYLAFFISNNHKTVSNKEVGIREKKKKNKEVGN
jgi:hypothetical protein